MPNVTVLPDRKCAAVPAGETVLAACGRLGLVLPAECGGKGTCGKCLVQFLNGSAPPTPANTQGLRPEEIEKGYRLACKVAVEHDVEVVIPEGSRERGAQILTTSRPAQQAGGLHPNLRQRCVQLAAPSLRDQASDWDRLVAGLGPDGAGLEAGLEQLRELPAALRAAHYQVTATLCGKRLLDVEPGDRRGSALGLAFDIGTTTVVGFLVNLATGQELALASRTNPQGVHGPDVLSRADYAAQGAAERQELQRLTIGCMTEIAAECAQKAGVSLERCGEVTFGGNTIMTHLLYAVPPRYITMVPFAPAWCEALSVAARDLGLALHPQARVYSMPCVAGYVGGDITGGVIATNLDQREKLTLFVDIGTNGEVVLGTRERLLACASPAGPAFEGARISCGMRAMDGAIDHVFYDPRTQDLRLTVLGGGPPHGICGTGLMDAGAVFLARGLVDPSGQIIEPDEAAGKLPPPLAARVREGEKGREILLVSQAQTLEGRRDIVLTRRDVRELQLAKGALRAGVDMALKVWGAHGAQLDKVLIAGGFGNYIHPASALAIGLFPPDVRLEQLEFVGNTAAAGARMALLDVSQRTRVERLARTIQYVELSGRPDFQDIFADAMAFPGGEE